ncbi:MAG: AraC family transcriptional regulator [Anaerocolumna sp.]
MQNIGFKESKIRGTFDFPIEFHYVYPSHPQYVMAYHWHVEYEIIRILSGIFKIYLDEREYEASAGDILFIHSGTLHGGIPMDCVYECIVFDMNMLSKKENISNQYIKEITNHEVVLHEFYPNHTSEAYPIISQLFDAMKHRKKGYQMISLGCFYQFIGTVLRENKYSTNSLQTPYNQKRIVILKQVLELIESSFHTTLTLEQLSKTAGMSPKYFCKFFQEMTHKSPFDYLNYYRIERACHQLLYTADSITDIAYNSGFNDLSYFIKTFKKYKEITPAKYRKGHFD